MRRIFWKLGAGLCLLCLCSCATVNLDTQSLTQPILMNDAKAGDYTVVDSFVVNDKAGWFLFIPTNEPAGDNQDYLADMLRAQVEAFGGDAAINVKIRVQNQPMDFVAYICTLSLYHTRTVTVTGDIIKYN